MSEKLLLVNPSYGSRDIIYFPLGLGYLAGACRKEDIEVHFVDMNVERDNHDKIVKLIREQDIHVVGIGGFITQLKSTLGLTKVLKEKCHDLRIVVGGIQVNGCERFVMENSDVDLICLGESEQILPEVVHTIYRNGDFSKIPSLLYRRNRDLTRTEFSVRALNLDELELPFYDVFPMEFYINGNYHSAPGRRTVDMICSRGCPYSCTYCINSIKSTKMRYRSPDEILKEIRLLKKRYAVNDLSFGDEIFTVDVRKSLEICEAIQNENVTWVTSVRADGINDQILTAMKRSGCRMLLIGFESGSNQILKSMNKKADLGLYSRSISLLRKHRMLFYSNFMIGMPAESEETIQETENFCRENKLIFGGSYVTPFPGTKLYDDVKNKITDERSYFLKLGNMNFSKAPIINLTRMSTKRLMYLRNRTVVNTIAFIIKGRFQYVPLKFIKLMGYAYLAIFNVRSPFISRFSHSIAKVIYKLFSGNSSSVN